MRSFGGQIEIEEKLTNFKMFNTFALLLSKLNNGTKRMYLQDLLERGKRFHPGPRRQWMAIQSLKMR